MSSSQFTPTTYDPVSRYAHWGIAVAMIGMIAMGIYIFKVMPPGADKGALIGLHKSVGVLVLLIGGWRVTRRLKLGFLPTASPAPKWQDLTARMVHWVLLAGIVVMPLSGLLGSFFGGRATPIFGVTVLPAGPKIEMLNSLAFAIHGLFVPLTIAALALHILGALKHHLIDRDATLLRMIGRA